MKLNITPVNSDSDSDTNLYNTLTDIDSPTSSSSMFVLNVSLDYSLVDEMIHENGPPLPSSSTIGVSTESSDTSDSSVMSEMSQPIMPEENASGDHEKAALFVKEFTQYFINYEPATDVVKIILNFDEGRIEDRFSVLVVTSMDGIKFKPVVIGKS